MENRILSADSHIVEPPDYWLRHIEPKYKARAPHAYEDRDGVVMFVVDGNIKVQAGIARSPRSRVREGNTAEGSRKAHLATRLETRQ